MSQGGETEKYRCSVKVFRPSALSILIMVTRAGTETLYFVEGIGNAFHFILHLQMPGLVQNNLCWIQ